MTGSRVARGFLLLTLLLAPAGCGPRSRYHADAPPYTTAPWGSAPPRPPGAPYPAPVAPPPPPSVAAWGLPCSADSQCLLHRCNATAGRCSFPCQGPADCATGSICMLGVCAGIPWTANSTPQVPLPGAPPSLPLGGADYDYRLAISLSSVPTYPWNGDDLGSPFLRDVMNHASEPFSMQVNGPNTAAHETLHGIHNDMRNTTSAHDSFVYVEQGQGAFLAHPDLVLSRVRDWVPAGARQIIGHRYDLYLVKQAEDWSEALYIFDEWSAYIGTSRVGVELSRRGWWADPSYGQDVVDGIIDFLYFGSAAMLALRQLEPNYFNGNKQLKAVFALQAEATMRWYSEGIRIPAFQMFHAEQLMTHFTSSPENADIRAMLREWYGPVWTQRVFGFL